MKETKKALMFRGVLICKSCGGGICMLPPFIEKIIAYLINISLEKLAYMINYNYLCISK